LTNFSSSLKNSKRKEFFGGKNQLRLAGFGEGDYQFLITEGVIIRKEPRDMDNHFDELEELVDELYERWRGGLRQL